MFWLGRIEFECGPLPQAGHPQAAPDL